MVDVRSGFEKKFFFAILLRVFYGGWAKACIFTMENGCMCSHLLLSSFCGAFSSYLLFGVLLKAFDTFWVQVSILLGVFDAMRAGPN